MQRISGTFQLINPQQQVAASGTIVELLRWLQPATVVAVGWHTWSERAARWAQRLQIPVVYWSHGVGCCVLYRQRPLQGVLRWLLKAPALIQVFRTLRCVDALVVAYPRSSGLDPRSLDAWLANGQGCSMRVIANPVDTQFWRPAESIEPSAQKLVSVGRLEWQKGHAAALAILQAAQLADTAMVVLAPEPTPYGNALLRQTQGRAARVEVRVGLDAASRRQILRQSLALISWSETEYQSLAMLEALACACPVIARPRGWLRGRIVPGVLVTDSPAQASIWLRRLRSNRALRQRLGLAGLHYVRRHHSLEEVVERWHALLKTMEDR